MNKETMKKMGFAALAVLLLAVTAISALSFKELYGGQWVCIAKECNEWATGDKWITDNCQPEGEGENKTLICKLIIEGNEYTAPLSIINVSNVKSCRQYNCITEVYVRGTITP